MIRNKDLGALLDSLSVILSKSSSAHTFSHMGKCSDGTFEFMKALNQFFDDIKCVEVIFTKNTDTEFFGIMVDPMINGVERILYDCGELPEPFHIANYRLELDSKLFDSIADLNVYEALSLIIDDIDKLTSGSSVREYKEAVDAICCGLDIDKKGLHNNMTKELDCLFSYATKETMYRMFSCCAKDSTKLILAGELVRYLGLESHFDSAIDKMQKVRPQFDNELLPTTSLNWCLYWFLHHTAYDTLPVYTLRQGLYCTGSLLMKRAIKQALTFLTTLDYKINYIEESKKKSLFTNIKLNGMKSLEDDVYEYSMRVKNIDDESSAILLMRQINSRIGIIEDYLCSEELSDFERKRWEKLYDKYDKLRDEMIKKPIYSRKMYGLFVDYNALASMSPENYMTMNTMY